MSDIEFLKNNKITIKKTSRKKEVPEKKGYFRQRTPKIIALAIGAIFILVLIGSAGYFYMQYKKAVKNTSTASLDEIREITQKIGKFMELPSEAPTLATVADKEKLKDQKFFQNAQNGDKVLIYADSSKAILWRPSAGKVIEVASLAGDNESSINESGSQSQIIAENQANNQAQSEPTTLPEESEVAKIAKVAVYNGSNVKGLAADLAEKIAAIGDVEITEKTNAKENYAKTIVIDLSGNNNSIVDKIIEALDGEAGTLPEEEARPDADILVIGGKQ